MGSIGLPRVPSHGIPPHLPLNFCPAGQKINYKGIDQRFFIEVSNGFLKLCSLREPWATKVPDSKRIPNAQSAENITFYTTPHPKKYIKQPESKNAILNHPTGETLLKSLWLILL